MSPKKKKVAFIKSGNWDSNNKPIASEQKRYSQHQTITLNHDPILIQRQNSKDVLIRKYNLTENEAEKILKNLERKIKEKKIKKIENQEKNTDKQKITSYNETYEGNDIIIPQHVIDAEHNKLKHTINKTQKEGINKGKEPKQTKLLKNEEVPPEHMKERYDVDKLIENIIPSVENKLAIEVNNVSLSFEVNNDKIDNLKEYVIRTLKHDKGKINRFQALKNISFKIYKGEKIGIIGYNGAGKSTLLNIITGIYPPETGYVKTYGKISPLLALGAGFDHNYSGRENIYLNGAILGYEKSYLEKKYDEIVEFSELEEFINFPVKNYSSGMLAKLGFSIATLVDPDILIIDEVLGVGDVYFQKKSNDKIKSLMDSGTTVILVSHSIPQIRQLCEKVIWIDQGMIREIGEVNEICNHYLKDAEKATKQQLKDIRFR